MSQGANLIVSAAGQATAPTSGTALATAALPAESPDVQPSFDSSKWDIVVNAVQMGTIDSANITSLSLFVGTTFIGRCMAGNSPFTTKFESVMPGPMRGAGGTVNATVQASANYGASAIVACTLTCTRMG